MAKAVTQRVKKKEKKNITSGVAHVNSTFNNTRVTITDAQGNTGKRYENSGSRSQRSGFGQRIGNQSFAGCRIHDYNNPCCDPDSA